MSSSVGVGGCVSHRASKYTKTGDAAFGRMEKVNAELLALTYGSIVCQLVKDNEDVDAVNAQLDKMGHNIGTRLIEEFLAKSGTGVCSDFRETAEVIAKVGMKMFLGISCDVDNWNSSGTSCSLIFQDCPLTLFVELPPYLASLCYANLLCGVIRGSLEQVHMKVSCTFVRDMLKGDPHYEISLELKQLLKEEFIDDEGQ
eukprot:GHVQ01022583.1.p1 GENE.GHVQ01022583.1~~GHVQ01022583.1.p1  ORF type:complete len:200 (+),score=28.84 GHVQ01022583.1:691-1290(+)